MRTKYPIIGLSGTNGSGKDTVGQIIANEFNYKFISVTNLLREEAVKRGLDISRENTRLISGEWRKEFGEAVLIDEAQKNYESLSDNFEGLIISSLRNSKESEKVHMLGGLVLWVDADPRLRYDRIKKNIDSRGRAVNDDISFDQFLIEDQSEMKLSKTNNTLNMAEVKKQADYIVINESSLESLKEQIFTIFH